ncbi:MULTISPECIES: ABC transporter substrate-binding protein [unclassified Rhizobacter]|uniref:ABC transporter substrate-binding protein n=1 Tax=unclassified Rhizobacter TaxID=2640088 RepID=UPI000700FC24|nr:MULTISPECIES: ABC transporter substrate-binding protein [unclassified Rhizobacter]KQU67754.1 branched-chain amino acid ABC transporter substrate-binding protein [Rhizobacter sp. Root29]KQW15362.1 branched-chain amino acid ABC transporter substrate-binding protein [Rhizobacter sp. Root1238]
MKHLKTWLATAALAAIAAGAQADVTIGVSVPLTGPTSALGIPCKNGISLWPATIAGEKLNVIVLDDATDPTVGVKNARRFVTEDKVDIIVGSAATPIAIAMSDVAAEAQTVQLALSPIPLPEGKGAWTFRLPQSTAVMSIPIVEHWKKTGAKTFGFVGYADAYGEAWLKDITAQATAAGIKNVGVERFARADTSITGQALKLVGANPDAILIAASGSGAAMPHKGLVERGYPKGKIYQTHGAATLDLIRVGGKDVEGSFVSSGPALVAPKLPDSNPSKALGVRFIEQYEKAFGPKSANQFGAHAFDAAIVLEKIIPMALKKAKPGTKEFRAALKEALETAGRIPMSQGVLNYTATDHFGFTPDTGVLLKVVNGDWDVVK